MMQSRCMSSLAAAMTCTLAFGAIAHAQMTPVAATGWNQDIVVEASATIPYSAFAQAFDVPNGYAFYESGLPGTTKGLPAGGAFTSALDGTQVQLQPYSGPNALFLNPLGTGTLTLAPAARRSRMTRAGDHRLFRQRRRHRARHWSSPSPDSSTSGAINFNAPDWFNGTKAPPSRTPPRLLV